MSSRSEMEAVLEAILFVAGEPVPRQRLLEVFEEAEREAAAIALDDVLARYAPADDRGVTIDVVGGGYRLVTRPELNPWLRRFFEVSGANKLSMAALETLAIVAYRQPVTGPEVHELRGVSSAGVIKTLLDRRLIRIAGRKQVVGKPFLYATTREFLMHFGLQSLKDLPPLEEFEELAVTANLTGPAPGEDSSGAGSRATAAGGEQAVTSAEPDGEEQFLREAAALEETST